jgi:hypothetical protein
MTRTEITVHAAVRESYVEADQVHTLHTAGAAFANDGETILVVSGLDSGDTATITVKAGQDTNGQRAVSDLVVTLIHSATGAKPFILGPFPKWAYDQADFSADAAKPNTHLVYVDASTDNVAIAAVSLRKVNQGNIVASEGV